MSGGSPPTSVAPAVGVPPGERSLDARRATTSTYWCYECDAGVNVALTAVPLLCSICQGDFLEQMELPRAQDQGRERTLVLPSDEDGQSTPLPPPPPLPEYIYDTDDDVPPPPPLPEYIYDTDDDVSPPPPLPEYIYDSDDDDSELVPPPPPPPVHEFLPESDPVLFRNIARPLPRSATQIPADDLLADLVPEGDPLVAASHAPAPKSSIDALPTVSVTDDFLAEDPARLCAVCKDEFVLGSEAKRLPCCHVYHGDCIVPWLSRHNSCPLCRSQLPVTCGGYRRPEEGPEPNSNEAGVSYSYLLDSSTRALSPWDYFMEFTA